MFWTVNQPTWGVAMPPRPRANPPVRLVDLAAGGAGLWYLAGPRRVDGDFRHLFSARCRKGRLSPPEAGARDTDVEESGLMMGGAHTMGRFAHVAE